MHAAAEDAAAGRLDPGDAAGLTAILLAAFTPQVGEWVPGRSALRSSRTARGACTHRPEGARRSGVPARHRLGAEGPHPGCNSSSTSSARRRPSPPNTAASAPAASATPSRR